MASCEICHGFSKVHPLITGKVDYTSLVFCTCQNDKAGQAASKPIVSDEPEQYHEITPADFDSPISWDMHRWICATYGKGDPGTDRLDVQPFEHAKQASTNRAVPTVRLDRMQGQLIAIRDTLQDLQKKKVNKVPEITDFQDIPEVTGNTGYSRRLQK